jgi:hypothetical protein
MKHVRYVILATVIVALMLLGCKSVLAQTRTDQYSGGGAITGYVYGFDMFDQLQPIAWATVTANNGQYTFVAYSGSGGYYSVFVATSGSYNVTVVEPGYKSYSSIVSVSPGSASTINFYLEQSHVPVPEFPSGMVSVIAMAALSVSMLALRRRRRKR